MNKKKLSFFVLISVFFLSLILLTVFNFYISPNNKSSEKKQITIRLQWHTQAQFAGYYTALEKGFYKEKGLDVKIEEGGYGKNALTSVKAGLEEFGTKWTADLIAAGDDYISLANIVKDNGLLMIAKKSKGIDSVEDFQGKNISIWFIGNEYQLFVLLDKYNISRDEVNIIPQKWNMSQFLNDETDVSAAMSYNELFAVAEKGFTKDKLDIFSFRDLGVGFPGHNIFTSKKFYKNNPEICAKFVKASLNGWDYAVEHPEEAVGYVMKHDKGKILNKNNQLSQMKEISELIDKDSVRLGLHLEKDYRFIEKVFKKYNIISSDVNIKNYFTNEFIKNEDKDE
ncbi:MAG: ABC transporter substrate-binding protein [Thermodesulfobacteriota bacterium]